MPIQQPIEDHTLVKRVSITMHDVPRDVLDDHRAMAKKKRLTFPQYVKDVLVRDADNISVNYRQN